MAKKKPNGKDSGRSEKHEGGMLRDAFIAELQDLYDTEKQLVKALPKLASAATAPELSKAFESHLAETRGHVERIEQAFETIGEKAKSKPCAGMAGIIKEGAEVMDEDFDEATMDAALIAGGQRAEHYEIAVYGTLVVWAKQLGFDEAAELLEQTLEEEKAADRKLTEIAEGMVNNAAATGTPEKSMGTRPPQSSASDSRSRSARR